MRRIICLVLCLLSLISFASCSEKVTAVKVNLNEVMAEIKKQVDLPTDDMMEIKTTSKLYDYYGISPNDVMSFQVQMNSSGVEQDEIIMIEATDVNAVSRIRKALQSRLDDKTAQMKNYNAEQYDILKECSVTVNGSYVALFISKDHEKINSIYESYFS